MKTTMCMIGLSLLLMGCDSANKVIDKAQETANQKVESLQTKIDEVSIAGLNLEVLEKSPELIASFTASINEALTVDISNAEQVTKVKTKMSNVYACLVQVSSESTAQEIADKLLEGITNNDIKGLIEQSTTKAQDTKKCVMP